MTRTLLPLCIALLIPTVAIAQGQIIVPPIGAERVGGYDIGLLSRAEQLIAGKRLMVLGRELSPAEQRQIAVADAVGAIMGTPGASGLAPMSDLAWQRGIFQEALRALTRGEFEAAQRGLFYTLAVFPDAKIVHACIAEMFRAAGADAQASRAHWAMSAGSIPSEDLLFVGLVKVSAGEPELQETTLPDDLGVLSEMEPSVVTFARAWPALTMARHSELAGEVKADVARMVAADEAATVPYRELAAVAVVELAHEASMAMSVSSDWERPARVRDNALQACIAACDGRWAEECIPRLEAALSAKLFPNAEELLRDAIAIAGAVAVGKRWKPERKLPGVPELPITRALAARN